MKKKDESIKKSLNVLHRDQNAPTAGGPDRDPAHGEESPEGKLTGVANPASGGALSGLDKGETWENKQANKQKASEGASPEEQRDQQTR